jgi:hypothetical protein
MTFTEIENPHIKPLLEGCRYVRATGSMCDCDTAIGCADNLRQREEKSQEYFSELPKLRKKGWSQHRIDRWVHEKGAASERQLAENKNKCDNDATTWTEFINKLLTTANVAKLGLLGHFYNGTLEEDRILIREVQHLRTSAKLKEQLMGMERDVLYWICR